MGHELIIIEVVVGIWELLLQSLCSFVLEIFL